MSVRDRVISKIEQEIALVLAKIEIFDTHTLAASRQYDELMLHPFKGIVRRFQFYLLEYRRNGLDSRITELTDREEQCKHAIKMLRVGIHRPAFQLMTDIVKEEALLSGACMFPYLTPLQMSSEWANLRHELIEELKFKNSICQPLQ